MAASSPSPSARSTWRCGISPARLAGVPLYQLLGGKRRDRVRAASSIIFDTANLDGIGRQFADLHARGYGVLKGGWGHDLSIAFGRDRSATSPSSGPSARRSATMPRSSSTSRRLGLDGEPRDRRWPAPSSPTGSTGWRMRCPRAISTAGGGSAPATATPALHRRERLDDARLPPTHRHRRARRDHDRSRHAQRASRAPRR